MGENGSVYIEYIDFCFLSDVFYLKIWIYILRGFLLHSQGENRMSGLTRSMIGAANGKSGVNYLKFILKASFPDARSRGKCVYARRVRCVNFRAISRQFPDPFPSIPRGKREKDRLARGSKTRLRIRALSYYTCKREKCCKNKIQDHIMSVLIARKVDIHHYFFHLHTLNWHYWYYFILTTHRM